MTMLLWVYKKDHQEFCKVQLHLPSGWTESEIQSYEITDTNKGENTRMLIDFLQLRGFHSVKRLMSDETDDAAKDLIKEGSNYQAMNALVQDTLEHSDIAVKVGRVKRLSYKTVCDLPFPVEKNCQPTILSFDHDVQPVRIEEEFFDKHGLPSDPYEDEWPSLEIFDVDCEAIEKPTSFKTKSMRRSRVRDKLFDEDSP